MAREHRWRLLGTAKTCEELFHAVLAMEWVDPPRTYEAHHLLVGTYMLRHPSGFTVEGRAYFASVVITSVDEGLSEVRERNRGRLDQLKRNWNIKAKESSPPRLREWGLTIADVLDGTAQDRPERVWRWARSVREELRGQQF